MCRQQWEYFLVLSLGCAAGDEGASAPLPPSGVSGTMSDAAALGMQDGAVVVPSVDASSPPNADAAAVSASDAAPTSADAGSPQAISPTAEVCNNGRDDDLDGLVDESCVCNSGSTQACYFGPQDSAGNQCPQGKQACVEAAEFAFWGPCTSTGAPFPSDVCACAPELCDNAKDDNCNGQVDEGCAVDVPVDIDGDCVSVSCPAWAPYPVGCDLTMEGGDSRGCVANAKGSSEVYFQEGDACPILGGILGGLGGDVGHISGKLLCSSQPGAALDAQRCKLNKHEQIFPSSREGCP